MVQLNYCIIYLRQWWMKMKINWDDFNTQKGIYINEMAAPRDFVLTKTKQQFEPLLEHILKCIIYKNNIDPDWVTTVGDICDYLNNFEVKTKSRRLKESDYYSILMPLETTGDYLQIIKEFRLTNKRTKQYPQFELNVNDAELLKNIYEEFITEAIKQFIVENNNSEKYFSNLLVNILKANLDKSPSKTLESLV